MTAQGRQKAREYVEGMRDEIINVELPVLSRYLLMLEKRLQNGSTRLHREVITQDEILLEIIRLSYRMMNLVHQLINTEPILNLLENHFDNGGEEDVVEE
jgi:hypothetical protein